MYGFQSINSNTGTVQLDETIPTFVYNSSGTGSYNIIKTFSLNLEKTPIVVIKPITNADITIGVNFIPRSICTALGITNNISIKITTSISGTFIYDVYKDISGNIANTASWGLQLFNATGKLCYDSQTPNQLMVDKSAAVVVNPSTGIFSDVTIPCSSNIGIICDNSSNIVQYRNYSTGALGISYFSVQYTGDSYIVKNKWIGSIGVGVTAYWQKQPTFYVSTAKMV